MSPLATVGLIARREVRQRLRSRLFVWSTLVLAVVLVVLALLPAIIGAFQLVDRDPPVDEAVPVAVVGAVDAVQRQAVTAVLGEVEVRRVDDVDAAAALVGAGEAAFAVIDGQQLLQPPPDSVIALDGGGRVGRLAEALAVAQVLRDADAVDEVLSVDPVPVEVVGPYDPGQELGQLVLANVGVVFLFAVLTMYATMIVNGIIEEKGSRVVELLVEAVPVRQLMLGKLLGLGAVGLAQTLVLFGPASLVLVVAGTLVLPGGGFAPLLFVVTWFVLGYAFYSVVAAALGALVSRPEEAQAVLTPASMLMVAGYLIGFFSINAPDGAFASITSWLPPTAPYVMLVRQLLGDPSVLEVAGAAAGVVAATVLLANVAARVYEGGILKTRSRIRLRDAWRLP